MLIYLGVMIKIEKIRKSFGDKLVLKDVNFSVNKGEVVTIIGASGSGKSTLLRCISRLTDATSGKIYIDGQDLLTLNNKELIQKIQLRDYLYDLYSKRLHENHIRMEIYNVSTIDFFV